ncbi:MAG: anti-sigma factor [Candidatus Baltobacteraceae bacterium]
MHCSSCEPLLDRYLEATLTPRRMAQVGAHVAQCAHCRALLQEVKIIDALLFTTRVPELPHNFTFAVMADVQAMPAVRAPAHRLWSFLAIYSAAAWLAVILGIALTGTNPAALLAAAGRQLQHLSAQGGALFALLPHTSPALATFGFGVLAMDAVLAGLVAALYFGVRPRLAAAFALSRRSGHD